MQLGRQCLSKAVHRKLGRGVEGTDWYANQSREREDVHDHWRVATLGLIEECGQEALDQGHTRVKVDVHDAIQHRHVTVLKELSHALSTVVHEDIDRLRELQGEV